MKNIISFSPLVPQIQHFSLSQNDTFKVPQGDDGNAFKTHDLNTQSIRSNSTFDKGGEDDQIQSLKQKKGDLHRKNKSQFASQNQNIKDNNYENLSNNEDLEQEEEDPYKIFNNSINAQQQQIKMNNLVTSSSLQSILTGRMKENQIIQEPQLATKVTSSTNLNQQNTFNILTPQNVLQNSTTKGVRRNQIGAEEDECIEKFISTASASNKKNDGRKRLSNLFEDNKGMPELRLKFKKNDQGSKRQLIQSQTGRAKDNQQNDNLNVPQKSKTILIKNGPKNPYNINKHKLPKNQNESDDSSIRIIEQDYQKEQNSNEDEDFEDINRIQTMENLLSTPTSSQRKLISTKKEFDEFQQQHGDQNNLNLNVSYSLNVFGVSTVDENGEFYLNKRLKRRRNAKFLRQESITQAIDRSKRKCMDRLVIPQNSRYKYIFSLLLMILTIYSTFTSTYFAAYGMTWDYQHIFLNYGIEIFFFIDIVQNFFYEFTSEEDYMIVREIRKISVRYLKSGFFWDLISFIPFGLFAKSGSETEQLLFLFKFLRIKKLFQLVHLRNFQNILKFYYQQKFKIVLRNPALKHDSKMDNNNIMKQIVVKYVIRVIRLIAILFILSYFIGTIWYIIIWQMNEHNPEDTSSFYTIYGLDVMKAENEDIDSMIIVVYWAFTTLSSLGYGDYFPRNNNERIVAIFVFLFGVALFTFIMNDLMEILMQYQRVKGDNNETESLTKWFGILARFNKGRALPHSMVKRFEDFFEYYWLKDKNFAMKSQADQRYLQELPKKIRIEIYKDFLYKDFLYLFRSYFFLKKDQNTPKNSQTSKKSITEWDELSSPEVRKKKATLLTSVYTWSDEHYSALMMSIMHHLQPRKFDKHDIIYDENDEVLEIIYVLTGFYGVGFIIDGRDHISLKLGNRTAIGDYQTVTKTCCEFRYRALCKMDCYVLKNFQIIRIIEKHQDMCQRLRRNIVRYYETLIRVPVLQSKGNEFQKLKAKQPNIAKQALEEIEIKRRESIANVQMVRMFTTGLDIHKILQNQILEEEDEDESSNNYEDSQESQNEINSKSQNSVDKFKERSKSQRQLLVQQNSGVKVESLEGTDQQRIKQGEIGGRQNTKNLNKSVESEAEEALEQIGDPNDQILITDFQDKLGLPKIENQSQVNNSKIIDRRISKNRPSTIRLSQLQTKNLGVPARRMSTLKSNKSPAYPGRSSKRGSIRQENTPRKSIKVNDVQTTDMEEYLNKLQDLEKRFTILGNAFGDVFFKYDEVLTMAANM